MKHLKVQPWLVQRAVYNHGCKKSNPMVSERFRLDYMGSSEFEWGAVPKSLRNFDKNRDFLEVFEMTMFDIGVPVYVVAMSREQAEEWVRFIEKNAEGDSDSRLKESTMIMTLFEKVPFSTGINFWFDLNNTVAMALDKRAAKEFLEAVTESVKFMDSKKKVS